MTEENKKIETAYTADNKKQKIDDFIINVRRSLTHILNLQSTFLKITIVLLIFLACIQKTKGFDMKEFIPIKHNIFVKGPDMHYFHNGPAILLNDGNVLVVGGETTQAEIYDYKKNKFKNAGEMNFQRISGAAMTLLNNGNVLITGGCIKDDFPNLKLAENSEIYNYNAGKFEVISKMLIPRTKHTSILLDNGNVLIFGGYDSKQKKIYDVEEFDIKTKSFKYAATLPALDNGSWHSFIKIDNSKFLLLGYVFNKNGREHIMTIYDRKTNNFYNIENQYIPIDSENCIQKLYTTNIPFLHYMSNLDDHNATVIVTYNGNSIVNISIKEIQKRLEYTSNKISNEAVIFIGGSDRTGYGPEMTKDIYLFDINSKNIIKSDTIKLNIKRTSHTAINLKNGNILILGGYGEKSGQPSEILTSEIFYNNKGELND